MLAIIKRRHVNVRRYFFSTIAYHVAAEMIPICFDTSGCWLMVDGGNGDHIDQFIADTC